MIRDRRNSRAAARADRGPSWIDALILSAAAIALLSPQQAVAQAPVPTTIREINANLPAWVGVNVEVEGVWITNGVTAQLWTSKQGAEITLGLNWAARVHITDGGAMPPDPTSQLYAVVRVQGIVTAVADTVVLIGSQQMGSIAITSLTVLVSPPEPVEINAPFEFFPQAGGEEDRFVIIVGGNGDPKRPDFWNDCVQAYKYYTETLGVPPSQVIVLMGEKGVSWDPSKIPTGVVAGGKLSTGGVFDCDFTNLSRAFDAVQELIKKRNQPAPKFDLVVTDHGGGYHTKDSQNSDGKYSGYAGGIVDFEGEEPIQIDENDLRFEEVTRGEYDTDGNGRADICVDMVEYPPPAGQMRARVRRDANGDGIFEQEIGKDTNGDHRVDKNDAGWIPPDLDRSGGRSLLRFEPVLILGRGQRATNDYVQWRIAGLQTATKLTKANSRAVCGQCMSGGFVAGLTLAISEAAAACGPQEYSHSIGGANGYNYYLKTFFDELAKKKTFKEAAESAAAAAKKAADQTPDYKRNSASALRTPSWQLLGDTFPVNETVAPGSVQFDTTTALSKTALNNGRPGGGEGVISGDTLVYESPWDVLGTRLDLVFRIWPGPGNYSVKGNRLSPPWKIPSNPGLGPATAGDASWWGQYMADNGQAGSKPSGHTSTFWDPQTWNSARMDSAQSNYSPIAARAIGMPVADLWMGTYHEDDPKFAILGVSRGLCFLIDPAGPVVDGNTCCVPEAGCPPPGYDPGVLANTIEGTKILPDGLFTPGTLIQYFVRRSTTADPTVAQLLSPDTSTVFCQDGMGGSLDLLRYDHMAVLPDMWKDGRFGGPGLACLLYFDAADSRGFEPAVRAGLDSLGFGLDNGAERGWKQTLDNLGNPDDPAGFVPVNLGQVGLAYDKYDIRAAEWHEGDRPGCRLATDWHPTLGSRQCKQGPTQAMLDYYYKTIIWDSGDLDFSRAAMHDGSGTDGEQSDDAALIGNWLASAGASDRKSFWGMGDGLAQDLALSATPSTAGLLNTMGAIWIDNDYASFSGNTAIGAVYRPLDADPGTGDPFHSPRRYGMINAAENQLDVLDRDPGMVGAERAGRYEQFSDRGYGGAGPYYASVYRRMDPNAGRFFGTLLDGFSLGRLRSWNGASDPGTLSYSPTFNNYAQQAWMADALGAFNLCARVAPLIAVGEQPGTSALNFVRGAFPNPSVAGAATVQFTLARPTRVTIRFYDVAGRLVHEASVDGTTGPNSYHWNGVSSTGIKPASGVYFYRLSAPGVDFQNNGQHMVLLGRARQ